MSVLDGALERGPFAAEGGRTDASFESAVLRDGRAVVVKHVTDDGLVAMLTGETNRLHRLWEAGVFKRVPKGIDHTMLAVEESGNGWILVMRDASDEFLGDDRVLSREENSGVLRAVDAMHREFDGERFDGGCSLDDHYSIMSPKLLDASGWSLAPVFKHGWELFAEVAPSDVWDVMSTLRDDHRPLVDELEKRPHTFIHGDLRLHNMGMGGDRIVLLDWEIAGSGPPAVEFAWYLIISATRIDATREEIVEDYKRVAGDRFDAVAWDLACIGALGRLGWNKALDIVESPDPALRAQERADLDWWIARVREALHTWSPV